MSYFPVVSSAAMESAPSDFGLTMGIGSSTVSVRSSHASARSTHKSSLTSVVSAEDELMTVAVAAPKARRGGLGKGALAQVQQQPPRCQVEGCNIDLSDVKAYYSRHKVCGVHSKSPMVIVGGIQQRFCQQCSRFHHLLEFDQGKRSCRRRLAGHNERRRKPPPGALFTTRYGRFSSSLQENGRNGILMDFSTYPRLSGRDTWPTTARASTWIPPGNHHQQIYANHHRMSANPLPGNVASHQYFQGGRLIPESKIPMIPGECFTGVLDSDCALSLLSNQPWCSKNQPFVNNGGAGTGMSYLVNSFTSNKHRSFKDNEASGGSSSSYEMPRSFGLRQPVINNFSGEHELELAHVQHSEMVNYNRAYSSSHN